MQIRDGQRLLERLSREGVAATAAAWVNESESGWWFLYLATPLVRKDGATTPAYGRLLEVIGEMEKEGFELDPFEIKVIGPHDPIARDIVAHRGRLGALGSRWFRGARLGELAVEVAYLYPPTASPEEAAGVS
jgi:hypothetical protein